MLYVNTILFISEGYVGIESLDLLADACLHWQAIVNFETGRVIGAEALIRSPSGTPMDLMREIARQGDWEAFTRWELCHVVSDLSSLSPLSHPFFAFFNLSPRQCVPEFLFPWLSRFPPWVTPVIEVLEEALEAEEKSVLVEAKRRGFHLAVDDFGSGHSNVSRLLDLSVDFVKIDRQLIQTTGTADRDLVEGISQAIAKFGINILGEGIETEAHVRFAGKIGCSWGQGWFFGREVPIRELLNKMAVSGNVPE